MWLKCWERPGQCVYEMDEPRWEEVRREWRQCVRRLEAAKATSVEAAEGVVERVTAARRTAVLVGTAGGVGGRRRERTWEPE